MPVSLKVSLSKGPDTLADSSSGTIFDASISVLTVLPMPDTECLRGLLKTSLTKTGFFLPPAPSVWSLAFPLADGLCPFLSWVFS